MKLANLAKLEKNKIDSELKEKQKLAEEYGLILKQPHKILAIIKEELNSLRAKYGDPRRTQIEPNLPDQIKEEELIPNQLTLITLSRTGYIKRMPPEALKSQKRGGKGVIGYETKNEEDDLTHLLTLNNRDQILFFTNKGNLFKVSAFEIAEGSRTSKGKLIQNYLNLKPGEEVIVLLNLPANLRETEYRYLVLVTAQGFLKKTKLEAYENTRKNGLLAIKLTHDDNLIGATFTTGNDELLLFSQKGQAIRFSEKELRPLGRTATGVRGLKLQNNDRVVSLISIKPEVIKTNPSILVVLERGYGKKLN